MTLNAAFCEYHRFDGPLQVGSHHIARHLRGRGFSTFWLPHPQTPIRRIRGELCDTVIEHEHNVVELTLSSLLPYYDLPFLGSTWWGRRWISALPRNRRLVHEAGVKEPDILWISDPTMLPVLDLIQPKKVVVRFFDHIRGFRGMPASIFGLVRRYVDRADLVVASSASVCDELKNEGIDAQLVQNAADPHLLGLEPVTMDPDRPRAVYVGAVDRWFDFRALQIWAEGLPHWTFDVFGPVNTTLPKRLPANVRFPGSIPYTELPKALKGCTFGIIPFIRSPFTDGIHPIKLYDYLSLGCRVLSAALPEISPKAGGIWTYDTAEQGLEILREHQKTLPDVPAIRRLASLNSWSDRLDPILDALGFRAAPVVTPAESK